jgi:hypothetical protein
MNPKILCTQIVARSEVMRNRCWQNGFTFFKLVGLLPVSEKTVGETTFYVVMNISRPFQIVLSFRTSVITSFINITLSVLREVQSLFQSEFSIRVQSLASSFNFERFVLSLMLSRSCLRLPMCFKITVPTQGVTDASRPPSSYCMWDISL